MPATKSKIQDRLHVPTEQEIEECKRLFLTCENARETLLEDKTQTRRTFDEPLPDWVDEAGSDFFSGDDEIAFRGTHPEHGRAEVFRDREYFVGETRLVTTPHWRCNYREGHVIIWDDAVGLCRHSNQIKDTVPRFSDQHTIQDSNLDWHQIHASFLMPKWASRILVEVKDVWVERVQEITLGDAVAEGCDGVSVPGEEMEGKDFRVLWNEIHGEDAWQSNDWVRCIEYELVT